MQQHNYQDELLKTEKSLKTTEDHKNNSLITLPI